MTINLRRQEEQFALASEANGAGAPIYMMGRSEAETKRLIRQSSFFNPFTRRLFEDAGLKPGMRVLDLGSGAGCVSLLAAELVGPEGSVVGVDQNPAVLQTARARTRAAGLTNVSFRQGDILSAVGPDDEFDAVVGRLVLMYLPDPAEALSGLARLIRPGGIVAFQEMNITPWTARCYPHAPLWQRFMGWMCAVTQQAGVETEMGYKLYSTYLTAGLPEPRMRLESAVGGGPDWDGYDYCAQTLRSVLPLVEKFGIATAKEVDIDTLAERLREETVRVGGVVKLPDLVSAWARIP